MLESISASDRMRLREAAKRHRDQANQEVGRAMSGGRAFRLWHEGAASVHRCAAFELEALADLDTASMWGV